MRRFAPGLWLAFVILAIAYLAIRLGQGVTLQSNILALLPQQQRDVSAQGAQNKIAGAFSRRVVFLVGDPAPKNAEWAARELSSALRRSGLVRALTSEAGSFEKIGAAYFPYRAGLLSSADRAALIAGKGQSLVERALSIVYGPGGFADARLIARDPFLLMPQFLMSLPVPQSRLAPDGDLLTVRDGGMTYVLVSAELAGDPYALKFEDRFNAFLAGETASLTRAAPTLRILRTGALFYAAKGAQEAMDESSLVGLASLAATLGLIFILFRSLRPILLGFAAVGVGILCAFAGTLALFGQMHVIALLFGVSLIGIAVDYSLQYFCEYFDPAADNPDARLRIVFPGIAIGVVSTLIGYCTLLLAPISGLRQVAVFSLIGLTATVLSVILWYPRLDTSQRLSAGSRWIRWSSIHWSVWEDRSLLGLRIVLVAACVFGAVIGFFRLRADDDVRHLQSLPPDLVRQEHEIERLTGYAAGTQFLLVRGKNDEDVLETEEQISDRLAVARREGILRSSTAISQFVPSAARQKSNRELVQARLVKPYLGQYLARIGYAGIPDTSGASNMMKLHDLPLTGPLSVLSLLDVSSEGDPAHIVLLGGVTDIAALKSRIADIPGVSLISLADDWTRLFGKYRRYATLLLALSAALMYPLLAWRYGLSKGAKVLAPSLAAVALTPPLAALLGVSFTFFNAMALVLVLSVGVDYAVFCSETTGARKPITSLAIALAALSTILSFGMLAFSRVFAVHAFGTTMFIGICLAFLFAPASGDGSWRSKGSR